MNYAKEKLQRDHDHVGDGIERGVYGVVCGGKNGKSQGADEQGKRVKPADKTRAKESGYENSDEQIVFCGLPAFVTIGFDEVLAALGFRLEGADKMVESAHRTDPPAEEAPKEQGGD